jgi:hypothetical protein
MKIRFSGEPVEKPVDIPVETVEKRPFRAVGQQFAPGPVLPEKSRYIKHL